MPATAPIRALSIVLEFEDEAFVVEDAVSVDRSVLTEELSETIYRVSLSVL